MNRFFRVQLTFEWPDGGGRKTVQANVGDTLFDVVLNNNLDIDGFGNHYFFAIFIC